MPQSILKGSDFLLAVGTTSSDKTPVAYATSHSLKISRETRDITSKQSGIWNDAVSGNMAWEVSVDALYALNGSIYDTLVSLMIAGNPVYVTSGQRQDDNTYGIGTGFYQGQAIITSVDLSASAKDNMTMSVSLTGVGALTPTGIAAGA